MDLPSDQPTAQPDTTQDSSGLWSQPAAGTPLTPASTTADPLATAGGWPTNSTSASEAMAVDPAMVAPLDLPSPPAGQALPSSVSNPGLNGADSTQMGASTSGNLWSQLATDSPQVPSTGTDPLVQPTFASSTASLPNSAQTIQSEPAPLMVPLAHPTEETVMAEAPVQPTFPDSTGSVAAEAGLSPTQSVSTVEDSSAEITPEVKDDSTPTAPELVKTGKASSMMSLLGLMVLFVVMFTVVGLVGYYLGYHQAQQKYETSNGVVVTP